MIRRPPRSTLLPDTTLFRAGGGPVPRRVAARRGAPGAGVPRRRARLRAGVEDRPGAEVRRRRQDRKSTRLNSSHANISYAVFCLKKKTILYFTLYAKPMLIH